MNTQGFIQKFSSLEPGKLSISEYNQQYVSRLLKDLPYMTKIYANILTKVQRNCNKPLSEITLLDFGGGSGLLSCFAKWAGVGRVIYLDIYRQSTLDAEVLAKTLNLQADEYITGEISVISTKLDVLVSMDVIEHVYDLEVFFKSCYELNPSLIQVHVTGANPYNPIIRKRLMELQIRNENEDRTPPKGAKPIDDYRSYKKIRKEWIEQSFGNVLTTTEIEELVLRTRGKRFDEMERIIQHYISTQQLPPLPQHPTNTCDPNTGNWSERLFAKQELENWTKGLNWQICYSSIGYNAKSGGVLKKGIQSIINMLATVSGKYARYILPLVSITIKPKG